MFTGSMVALVTPFKNGQVDWPSLEALVEFHFKNGTNGIVPCGTTGESATLEPCGTRRSDSHRDQSREQTRARHCRHRVEFHRRGGSLDQGSGKIRRRRRADDLAVLQPADPGRHLSALQESRLGSRYSADRLQHSRPHRFEDRTGDFGAACRNQERCRRQRSHRFGGPGHRRDPSCAVTVWRSTPAKIR